MSHYACRPKTQVSWLVVLVDVARRLWARLSEQPYPISLAEGPSLNCESYMTFDRLETARWCMEMESHVFPRGPIAKSLPSSLPPRTARNYHIATDWASLNPLVRRSDTTWSYNYPLPLKRLSVQNGCHLIRSSTPATYSAVPLSIPTT